MAMDEWLMWQLVDSALPIGALAHSNGLEAAVQHGLVTDGKSLEEFVRASVRQCTRGILTFVGQTRSNPADFEIADRRCDLFLNNHVTNRASRAQGRAFLMAATRIFETGPTMTAFVETDSAVGVACPFCACFWASLCIVGCRRESNQKPVSIPAGKRIHSAVP